MNYNKENLIKQETIQTLIDLGDADGKPFYIEIIEMYLSETNECINKIVNAVKEKNQTALTLSSHKLKGSSANIGAAEVSAICSQIEKMSKNNDYSDMNEYIYNLENCYKDTCIELKKIINK